VVASAFLGDTRDSGNLWVYLQPDDFRQSIWGRIAIASDFSANGITYGNRMTPGKFREFYPTK